MHNAITNIEWLPKKKVVRVIRNGAYAFYTEEEMKMLMGAFSDILRGVKDD
jgi:hypothetical protein